VHGPWVDQRGRPLSLSLPVHPSSYLHPAGDGGRNLGSDPFQNGRVHAVAALARQTLAGQLEEDAAGWREEREGGGG